MNDQAEALKIRTKQFALDVIRLSESLPATYPAVVIQRQLIRSATGTAANYRSACRSRSRSEFIARIGVALEEADETEFWLELLRDGAIASTGALGDVMAEAHELCAIFARSRLTAIAARDHERHDNRKPTG